MKTLGILGGMGPQATVHLYNLIIAKTPAERDQDHIETVIISDPKIPDRTRAILSNTLDPVINRMIEDIRRLEQIGAEIILIPCNTAHYFISHVKPHVNVPILNMIKLTGKWIHENIFEHNSTSSPLKIGLFATKGTLQSQIYPHFFKSFNFDLRIPPTSMQDTLMKIVYDGIKKRGPSSALKDQMVGILDQFRNMENLDWIILGCTEIPLLFRDQTQSLPDLKLIDPMEILAEYGVDFALS